MFNLIEEYHRLPPPVHRIIQGCALGLSLSGYVWLGYFVKRGDFLDVFLLYSGLFALYLLLINGDRSVKSIKFAIGGAVIFRLALLLMTPNLTNDYYRYIWDGLLTASGINPYLLTPAELVAGYQMSPDIGANLIPLLNSANFISAYPPAAQYLFWVSARVAGADVFGNIIALRVLLLLAESGTIWLLHKLAVRFGISDNAVLIYALNPLVIVELTGNLHLEAFMFVFLLLAVYFLCNNNMLFSAISMGAAVGTKLFPLVFLPLLIKRFGLKRSFRYYLLVGITLLLLSAPFLNERAIPSYLSSLLLYFRLLEFNASVYYIFRWFYFRTFSETLITTTQWLLPLLTLLTVAVIAVKQKTAGASSLFTAMLWCLTAYFILTNNVHAWNLTTLVLLSIFTRYRFALLWSWAVVLAYSAYRTYPYSENLVLVAVEYLLLIGFLAAEIFNRRIFARPGREGV